MRGLDTNVLVRYLTADEPKQLALAQRVLEESDRDREPVFLSVIVLCELVWVLSRAYGHRKAAIAHALEHLLEVDRFQVEHDVLVRRSLDAYRNGPGSFSDYLIGEISLHYGCRDVVTFDRSLKSAPGFSLLG